MTVLSWQSSAVAFFFLYSASPDRTEYLLSTVEARTVFCRIGWFSQEETKLHMECLGALYLLSRRLVLPVANVTYVKRILSY